MVSYLIATAIWPYRLRRATDGTWGSVANADAPLAYELSSTPAFGGHIGQAPTKRSRNRDRSKIRVPSGGYRFNQRLASRIRNSVGSNQEYQSVSAITLRLLALIALSLVTNQSETKPTAGQWLGRGVTEVLRSGRLSRLALRTRLARKSPYPQ